MLLHAFARRVVRRYRPHVVAVTGSYGKTAAKEAIAAALGRLYNVHAGAKSFNNELGVPFTILGVQGGDTVTGVSRVVQGIWRGLWLILTRQQYPAVLVVEMGADKPGDLKISLDLAAPSVAVITGVGPTHLMQFGSVENVFAEKSLVASAVPEGGWVVLNGDDPRVRTLAEHTGAAIVSYGFSGGVAVRCVDAANAKADDGVPGLLLTVQYNREKIPVFVPGVTGTQSAYAVLAAIACGIAFRMDLPDIIDGLSDYAPPPGRMRVIAGINGSMLIDDSYNSSPDACLSAIEALRQFPAEGRRIAVLGEMADLGSAAVSSHRTIGRAVVENGIDALVCVGGVARAFADGARGAGMPDAALMYAHSPREAAELVRGTLRKGDTVLLKGSQVSRMERATASLMAEPGFAKAQLVRQDAKWLRR